MGLLLSVLITCVGVLEVIACYTHFRVGNAYTECKSNIRDIAKYYAVELRKHELHFEPGPDQDGASGSKEETLSELIRTKSSIRVQEVQHQTDYRDNGYLVTELDSNLLQPSCSQTPDQGTPDPAPKVPRNSICGYDSPAIDALMKPNLDAIAGAIKIHENDESFWSRKTPSPSPLPDKNWKSRSVSPIIPEPKETDTGLEITYTPGLRKHRSLSPLLSTPVQDNLQRSVSNNTLLSQQSTDEPLSPSDLEVKMILESNTKDYSVRKPSPCPEILFTQVNDTDDQKYDEEFLRSLDGVKPGKCNDRRSNFKKKRNSSSNSSKTSLSFTSVDDGESDKRNNIDQDSKKFIPVVEEELNGHEVETILSERCESILASPKPDESIKISKQEETLFQAKETPNTSTEQKINDDDKSKANLSFTEKVKDLEISVQLLVTVKGTNQGDNINITAQPAQTLTKPKETITETTEKKSEFSNVKTSVTYGSSTVTPTSKSNVQLKEIADTKSTEQNLKDLQISSQSLICAERTTVQDDVVRSEDEFLKLYESFTELPEKEKDKFLQIIGRSSKSIEKEITYETEPQKNDLIKENKDTSVNTTNNSIQQTILEPSKTVTDLTLNSSANMPVQTQEEIIVPIKEDIKNIINQETDTKSTSTNEIKTQSTTKYEEKNTNISETPLEPSKSEPITNERIEEMKKETAQNSSDSSSETPPTVQENPMRRASKTSFEEASFDQHQELMKRRVSTSEASPKQANQAFWLIFSAEYTNAMEKDWHGQHFSCWQCDESLTGQRYVLRDEHPYCVKCYEQVFANTCEKCNKIIGIDSKDLSYKEKHWHEACFQCTTCQQSLVDKQFGAKGEKIYCGNCYDNQFASRCDGCSKIFHAGTKKMEYKNRQWHEQCFKCCKCATPIGTKSFIPREKDIYCAGCYEEKFATRCVKCDKAIQSGGVTYKNEPWHRECFTCTHCNKNLAGQRFTSRDDKPCCADCFGRLFAKRCTSCNEPITGIGGTRFISFEDRHWHNDCFICANCSISLVGRGFITDEEKIICPECAKERFM